MSPPPQPQKLNHPCKLTASSISYMKPTTCCSSSSRILHEISLTAHPSEILAIVGPSGAGKSTLLDILAARVTPSHGALLLNSSPINLSSFRKISVYVPQHDSFIPSLTVAETFSFSASLLIPPPPPPTHSLNKSSPSSSSSSSSLVDTTAAIVSSLLRELRLTHLADTRIGEGLSGGERRRVSIGLSLLHNPSVLILDEPTSGLDSCSAYNVIHILKSIAVSNHRTVVLSIHQPSFKILTSIDRILVLSKGTVVHHGTLPSLETFLLSNGFTLPPQLNPVEFTLEILNQLHSHVISKSTSNTLPPPPPTQRRRGSSSSSYCVVWYNRRLLWRRMREIWCLYDRSWKTIYRTRQLLLTNTLEAFVVGMVLGTIYMRIGYDKEGIEKRFGLFAFTLTFLLSSTTETLPIFINERAIVLREASSGVYKMSSYVIANTLVFTPYLLAVAMIYSFSVYFLVGLCGSWRAFAYFVMVIWIIVLMANSFVLFLSSLAPNYIAGTSLVTILLAAFFLFSGYFISKESLPKYWLFMHFFSMYKYALDALLINEYSCLLSRCFVWYEGNNSSTCMVTGGDVLQKRGLHESQRWTNVYFLIGFFLFYRLLCFLVLLRSVSQTKK